MLYTTFSVSLLVIGAALCAPERVEEAQNSREAQESKAQAPAQPQTLQKRSPHDYDVGKRAYSYVSEYKRLPVYNFGLGKRSARPYSFGLGKRSLDEEPMEDQYPTDIDQESTAELLEQYDDNPTYDKRARPFSFGLGKSYTEDEFDEEKRARMYDFGLGKRLPHQYSFGLGKRARNYNFGLGKRLPSKFNFGLGKRERDLHRFNFGLGKRSADDTSDHGENRV